MTPKLNDPTYFTNTSDDPYDRHTYRVRTFAPLIIGDFNDDKPFINWRVEWSKASF